MNEETIDYVENTQRVRPTLLTVMCVITWVYAGYTLLSAPFSFFMAGDMEAQNMSSMINEAFAQAMEEDPESGQFIESFADAMNETLSNSLANAGWLATSDILGALLSSLGAFMMFRLKKVGFWIYLAAKALGIILFLALVGTNFMTYSIVVFIILFDIVLSVLYAVNLKYMR
jgi:hypothetical protein